MEIEGTGLPTPPTTAAPDLQSTATSAHLAETAPPSSETPPATAPPSSAVSQLSAVDQQAPQHDITTEALMQRIIMLSTAQEYQQLVVTLRETHGRESIFLQGVNGEDPLMMMDANIHTLGMLYFLTARLRVSQNVVPVPLRVISEFCSRFDPVQARMVPERVTALARGILQYAEDQNVVKAAIAPLYDLLTRHTPDLTYLTSIHQYFLTACVSAQHYTPALPIIGTPISNIAPSLYPDLTYIDHIVYHYTAGVAAAALRKWDLAADLLETCASAPVGRGNFNPMGPAGPSGPQGGGPAMVGVGMSMRGDVRPPRSMGGPGGGGEPSAVQVDAMKKLVLVQLIQHGKQLPITKYTHPSVARIAGPGSPYGALARSYPGQTSAMQQLVEKERLLFSNDGNLGLVKIALARASRWTIKKLTETYLTLGLAEIGQSVGIDDVEEVRKTVLSMIGAGEINATISADGTVAFADDPPLRISKAEMDAVLARAQAQEKALRALEREMAVSKEYLTKALRSRDDTMSGAWTQDESEWQSPSWVEETLSI